MERKLPILAHILTMNLFLIVIGTIIMMFLGFEESGYAGLIALIAGAALGLIVFSLRYIIITLDTINNKDNT